MLKHTGLCSRRRRLLCCSRRLKPPRGVSVNWSAGGEDWMECTGDAAADEPSGAMTDNRYWLDSCATPKLAETPGVTSPLALIDLPSQFSKRSMAWFVT